MNPFRNFMLGRYGTDQLTIAMLVLGMIFTFIGDALDLHFLTLLTYVIFALCVYRVLSKNASARRKENYEFLKVWNPASAFIMKKFNIIKNSKDYKYFKCPSCGQMLRAPKGKGNISVTCQKCKTKFNKRV